MDYFLYTYKPYRLVDALLVGIYFCLAVLWRGVAAVLLCCNTIMASINLYLFVQTKVSGEVFLNHLECEISNINNAFAHPKPPVMTEQDTKDYEATTNCWLCDKKTTTSNPKVMDHCHFTDKYRGAAHKSCNLKLKPGTDKHLKVKYIWFFLKQTWSSWFCWHRYC